LKIREKEAELMATCNKKSLHEKLGSDISSSEDELLTGDTNKKPKSKHHDGNLSPIIGNMKNINVNDDSKDLNWNGDRNLDDDQVIIIRHLFNSHFHA
jgi:hypothetical protein